MSTPQISFILIVKQQHQRVTVLESGQPPLQQLWVTKPSTKFGWLSPVPVGVWAHTRPTVPTTQAQHISEGNI